MSAAKTDLPQWAKTGFKKHGFEPDDDQKNAVIQLDKLFPLLKNSRKNIWSLVGKKDVSVIQGTYIYGPVGRGKSFVMDLFYNAVSKMIPKRRVHFHEFMIEVHDFLHKHRQSKKSDKGADEALLDFGKSLATEAKLLCFDEFHVTNVADAMLLSRLFTALFEANIIIVMTSNWTPDRLYEGGLQRVRFLPFIDLIKSKMICVEVAGNTDYRKLSLGESPKFFNVDDKATRKKIDNLFDVLTGGAEPQMESMAVRGRTLEVLKTAKGIARFDFGELFEKPLGAEDYLVLAHHYNVLFVENIPALNDEIRNETKRFMSFIDVMYDQGRALILSANTSLENLYQGKHYEFEFERTLSRLYEMQTEAYLKKLSDIV